MSRFSWLRTCRMADAVLPSTLAPSSSIESSRLTWVWVTGTVPVRPEARRSLKSDRPSQPSERQKRMTVGWLTRGGAGNLGNRVAQHRAGMGQHMLGHAQFGR